MYLLTLGDIDSSLMLLRSREDTAWEWRRDRLQDWATGNISDACLQKQFGWYRTVDIHSFLSRIWVSTCLERALLFMQLENRALTTLSPHFIIFLLLLVSKGADISAQCVTKTAPLMKAFFHGHTIPVEIVIELGAGSLADHSKILEPCSNRCSLYCFLHTPSAIFF